MYAMRSGAPPVAAAPAAPAAATGAPAAVVAGSIPEPGSMASSTGRAIAAATPLRIVLRERSGLVMAILLCCGPKGHQGLRTSWLRRLAPAVTFELAWWPVLLRVELLAESPGELQGPALLRSWSPVLLRAWAAPL